MRLRNQDIIALRAAIYAVAPDAAGIRLFDSRLDDNARGGDIDLMIDFERPVENPAVLSARLAVRASRAIFHRKVDVLLRAPNLMPSAVHQIALEEGVLL
ncbi:MAG: DNA polymerase III subunit beta [Gammaproteobacteria bacterium HGW-Gammaproteobacteria-3]|jgi:predicted nucleotidyltransferase|nr:MAG: DNA polymerase III subunit beta [Gammaproteobacteria bacterium HGW-Gammaproteobacteria-3]